MGFIGFIGSLYAILGGFSDSINGSGLLIPIFGLIAMGKGSFFQSMLALTSSHVEKLNVMGSSHSIVPIGTVVTGMVLVNTFYWCTNQGIIQRTFATKNLGEEQKGIILTGLLKLLGPIILVLPDVIAFHLYPNLSNSDTAYLVLVSKVLPSYLSGFFGAVLLGVILSSPNSFLNSASTLFSLGIYNRIINIDADEKK